MPRQVPLVRACTRCQSTTNEFGKCSKVSDGKASTCKPCQRELFSLKYQSNPKCRAQSRESSARWAKANAGKALANVKDYQSRNPGAVKASRRAYVASNREVVYAKNAARHCQRKQASVAWGNRFLIREIYHLAKVRSRLTGVQYVVDHVIPLNHPLVCGLHVEHNLQVIPEVVNLAKSNAFTPI